ncbi:hypothetical protein EW146_g2241 [Bondarzewia mesenterica]|uniref:AB hydrolase-1 domain-containing protein n=1 Tax=Bondarzewia mesenterica TaxID=1095465 RepID=A0A4V3XFU8_9AGAM|nr:hypothetical protein EW146_g2241 [Bondarzewia mesenterica]
MTSRRVPGRFPAVGSSPIADRIRERRGARGLTPLDGTLLHVPQVADGWNSLLGAIRTKGNLPGDVRESMILRVAAHNHAAFEWIQHEHVARDLGVTTAQLSRIRDTSLSSPSPSSPGALTPLQAAAVAFADSSTKKIKVSDEVVQALTTELGSLVKGSGKEKEDAVQDLLVEAAAVVATYNMVSRFLVSLDVAGMSDNPVPYPVETTEHTVPLPSGGTIHAITLITSPTAPWLAFSNSLLTSTKMWSFLGPKLTSAKYNLLLHDQRGHGLSSVPNPPSSTINDLADDIVVLLTHLQIPKLYAMIGVSQGGATALAFAVNHPELTERVVACDTQPVTPQANVKAWDDRIELAKTQGMDALATVTAGRWFPEGSAFHPSGGANATFVLDMITTTSLEGFIAGARALQSYDLISAGLLKCKVPTLLVAGEKDGVLPGVLGKLKDEWAAKGGDVRMAIVPGSGHLPMVDGVDEFARVVLEFLRR